MSVSARQFGSESTGVSWDSLPPPDWECEHAKLYCGDCLDVLPKLQDRSIDFVFTDPPYGHNNNNGDLIHKWESALGRGPHGESRAINNDGREANDLYRVSLPHWKRLLSSGGCCCCCCCCCGGGGPDPQFARWSLWMDEVFQFKQMVIFDKGPMGMGWHYRRSYETVLVGEVPGAACRWFDDSSKIENIIRPGDYGIRKIIPSEDQHPTEKPWQLAAHFIKLHSQPDDVVLDSFMGSGSTGVAALKLGRRFVGIESDPTWFALAVRRIDAEARQGKLFQ